MNKYNERQGIPGIQEIDEVSLFEIKFLDWISTVTIFLILGVAIFNFTPIGKNFSLIAILIALVLVTTLIFDYLSERNRIVKLGFNIRPALDILFGALVATFILLVWITYEVWKVDQSEGYSFPVNLIEKELNMLADKIVNGINKNKTK